MRDATYQSVLTDHGLRAHAATDQEKSLAVEVAQLRNLLADGDCAHDVATLRNVQEQRRKVVAAAMAVADRPDDAEAAAAMVSAVREFRRITGQAQSAPVRMWLDDVRPPHEHGRVGWTWVKTADEAIALLATGTVVEASLDHDLDASATLGNTPTERTGYDVVCWMEKTNIWPRDGVHVHSMNPSGAARMRAAIRRTEVLR